LLNFKVCRTNAQLCQTLRHIERQAQLHMRGCMIPRKRVEGGVKGVHPCVMCKLVYACVPVIAVKHYDLMPVPQAHPNHVLPLTNNCRFMLACQNSNSASLACASASVAVLLPH
jgi:hypothetical protein